MKKYLLSYFVLLLFVSLKAQQMPDFNIEVLSQVDVGEALNDVWGFQHTDGTEYAIVGTVNSTVIYSLEDLANPVEVARIPGANSVWRDMKDYNDYVYVVADQGSDGILSVDMRNAPDDISWTFSNPGGLETTHNIYVDENGYGYLAGGNLNGGGIVILDCFTNQDEPSIVGYADTRYSHDVYVRNDTAYSSDIFSGFFSVIDVTDKAAPQTLAAQSTSRMFTHNAWTDDDAKYIFTTDELGNANVDAYDISDLSDIKRLDTWHPEATEGRNVVPHNTHYLSGYLITSYYTDGIKITDVHRPENMVEVGSFDTWPDGDGGTNGCWGAFPFLRSGVILATDRAYGFFVLQPDYERATYLEGKVVDAMNGDPINQAEVILEGIIDFNEFTSSTGEFKTGQFETGSFDVRASHPNYNDGMVTVDLVQGEVTEITIELVPKQVFSISGIVTDSLTSEPIGNATIIAISDGVETSTLSEMDGSYILNVLEGNGTVIAGAWGFNYKPISGIEFNGDIDEEFELFPGYRDDFLMDFGWSSTGDAGTGAWVRGNPIGTSFGNNLANPEDDVNTDLGLECYMTGNGGGNGGTDDVDDGTVILTSPIMNVESLIEPVVEFNYWFVNGGGQNQPNDTLKVYFITPEDGEVLVDFYTQSNPNWSATQEYVIEDYVNLNDSLQVRFVTNDDENSGNICEAAIDQFFVSSVITVSTDQRVHAKEVSVSPNPFNNEFQVDVRSFATESNVTFSITDVKGRIVEHQRVDSGVESLILGSELEVGIYFLQLKGYNVESRIVKLIKI